MLLHYNLGDCKVSVRRRREKDLTFLLPKPLARLPAGDRDASGMLLTQKSFYIPFLTFQHARHPLCEPT